MIELDIQIKSLIFSFFFGMLFSFILNINYKYLYNKKIYIKLIISFLFVLDSSMFYFLVLNYINNGIIHIYFLIMAVLGFALFNKFYNKHKNRG